MPGLSLAHPIVDIRMRTHEVDPDGLTIEMKTADRDWVAVHLSRRMGLGLLKMLEAELLGDAGRLRLGIEPPGARAGNGK